MNRFVQISKWAETHTPMWLDGVRICLGTYLAIKGLILMFAMDDIYTTGVDSSLMFFHYAIFTHFVGGVFLAMGLLTRWASLANIPIMIGAMGLSAEVRSLVWTGALQFELALVILLLLMVFVVFGGGRLSIDNQRRKEGQVSPFA